jgi:gluconolactonase
MSASPHCTVAEPILRVRSPAGISTTNIAYGGPDNATLFITESEAGSILMTRMPAPGQTLYSHD